MDITQYKDFDDAEIIRLFLKAQDKRFLSVLYQRYAGAIFRKCYTMVKKEEAAKDLTHDIFLKAFLQLPQLKRQDSFKFWLNTIAYNHCINYLKLEKKFKKEDIDLQYNLASQADEEKENKLLHEMNLQQLEYLVGLLPDDDRLILLMQYQDEMSIKEISFTLSIGESAVKMRVKRAKAKLAELFKQQKEGGVK